MSSTGKTTGGGGSFTFNGASIPFNTIEPSVERELDDATDSTNYDSNTQIVHKSQLAVTTQTTFAIEGKFNTNVIPAAIVQQMYSGGSALPAAIKYNGAGVPYGNGLVDLSNFKCTIDPTKTVTYSATLMSNGVFTPNV